MQRIRQNRFHYLQNNFFEHEQELKHLLDPNTGRIQAQLDYDRNKLMIDLIPIDTNDNMNERMLRERFRQSEKRDHTYRNNNNNNNNNDNYVTSDNNRGRNDDYPRVAASKQQDIYFEYAAPQNRYTELLQKEINEKNRQLNYNDNNKNVNNINNNPFFATTTRRVGVNNNNNNNSNNNMSYLDRDNLQTDGNKNSNNIDNDYQKFTYSFGKHHKKSILDPTQTYNFKNPRSKGAKKTLFK